MQSVLRPPSVTYCYSPPLSTSRVGACSGFVTGPLAFASSLSHSTRGPLPSCFAEIQLCVCVPPVHWSRGGTLQSHRLGSDGGSAPCWLCGSSLSLLVKQDPHCPHISCNASSCHTARILTPGRDVVAASRPRTLLRTVHAEHPGGT